MHRNLSNAFFKVYESVSYQLKTAKINLHN